MSYSYQNVRCPPTWYVLAARFERIDRAQYHRIRTRVQRHRVRRHGGHRTLNGRQHVLVQDKLSRIAAVQPFRPTTLARLSNVVIGPLTGGAHLLRIRRRHFPALHAPLRQHQQIPAIRNVHGAGCGCQCKFHDWLNPDAVAAARTG